ncbi:putative Glutamyl-tRNA synthetase, cytoplasmic [Lophiotrema nucula]|uniref:glutamate--tRNA ligase n=1 Tax=Lophiotrema nucula TaxID=690887 RepID=A0A6A5ZBA2_9PLEO|nr:putative Glutamyl-tRNA synthetase, cytoplasmic [Lophiotrema nucula]
MAHLQVASKANPALVLPVLLVAQHLERNGLLAAVTKTFLERDVLSNVGKQVVQLQPEDGESVFDGDVIGYLTALSGDSSNDRYTQAIHEWVARRGSFTAPDFQSVRKPIDELNDHLTLRSYMVGYSLTVADLAVWATLRGNRVTQSLVKKTANNVSRWYSFIEASNPWIAETVMEFTAHAFKERNEASAAGASYDIDLPQVGGPMVTRFPPEPSGYLHIGHAKAALLNDYFAHKSAGGTLICRFDDTNPSKEKMEFQEAILQDLKLMDIIPDKITYSSDYFQEMYEYALQLIQHGKAFADDSELGKGDEDRKNRLPSKRRDLGIGETLARFAEMKTGSEDGQRWCLRARIAYDSPNGTLRDPVLFRCNLIPHHRTGTQWTIYPTYDFCAPILDSIEGVTLALRTNEYRDRNAQYDWMQDALKLRKVAIWDFSRMNFVRTVLSKRKLTKIVNEGKVWGWDDPRMPTIRGILRRGMTVPALREFILKQGPSRNVLNLEWGAFWAVNKKYIDPVAPRYTAIAQEQAVHCQVHGFEGPANLSKPKHAKNLELGTKQVIYDSSIVLQHADAATFKQDEKITLMNWGNAYVRKITKDSSGDIITGLEIELISDSDFKKTKKITWLAAKSDNLIPVELVAFEHLVTKDKLEKDDVLENFLTPVTEFREQALADCNVAELPQGAILQFERKGYYKLDGLEKGNGSRMVFFNIPA